MKIFSGGGTRWTGCENAWRVLSRFLSLVFLPCSPPFSSRHACLHDESSPFATLPHEWPYSRYRLAAAQPIEPPPPKHSAHPPGPECALSGQICRGDGIVFVLCVHHPRSTAGRVLLRSEGHLSYFGMRDQGRVRCHEEGCEGGGLAGAFVCIALMPALLNGGLEKRR